jgi:hypothetical protein
LGVAFAIVRVPGLCTERGHIHSEGTRVSQLYSINLRQKGKHKRGNENGIVSEREAHRGPKIGCGAVSRRSPGRGSASLAGVRCTSPDTNKKPPIRVTAATGNTDYTERVKLQWARELMHRYRSGCADSAVINLQIRDIMSAHSVLYLT